MPGKPLGSGRVSYGATDSGSATRNDIPALLHSSILPLTASISVKQQAWPRILLRVITPEFLSFQLGSKITVIHRTPSTGTGSTC